ncbi:tetratricopeptide repeat protein [Rhodotorula paludigena]|uniref:tetratricopeptide repeat protein n=1 Tax=Rhodotorula paludigena TaxID=86838 RepID=UPI00316C0475
MTATPPSPPSSSLASLVTALSEADAAASAALLFSPHSSRGTGATGSTEPAGQATRSLVGSVEGRERESEPSARAEEARDEVGSVVMSSWDRLSAHEPRAADGTGGEASVQEGLVHLPTPEPDERRPAGLAAQLASPIRLSGDDDDRISIKAESDDGAAERALLSSAVNDEDPAPLLGHDGLTDSQEDALLAQPVTRSQSDFSHWLEETLRHARGDGSSTIESDDALSSIIEATRHAHLGWSSGFSADGAGNDRRISSGTGALLDLVEQLPGEDITLSTVPPPDQAAVEDKVVDDTSEEDEPVVKPSPYVCVLGASGFGPDEPSSFFSALSPAASASSRGWQLLSLALAVALAISVRRRDLPVAVNEPQLEPTRSLRYVPLNETTVVSHFATPIPIGSTFSLPFYLLAAALATAGCASIPFILHRRTSSTTAAMCTRRSRTDTPVSPPRSRATSPLLELHGDALLEARALLPRGIEQYAKGQLSEAATTFRNICGLACAPPDKALASEWLGRTLYRLAQRDASRGAYLVEAAEAFERSVRLDQARATPRASLGRVKFRLGDYEGAVISLRAALKRDESLAFAHEYLAKSLAKLVPRSADCALLIEEHLQRAITLDPHSYTALAFLGEFLHLSGGKRTAEARSCLERAVSLRHDYPAAHARLAFIANEELDPARAAAHYAYVVDTRYTGLRDSDALAASEDACEGTAPFLAWTFATAPFSLARRAVLARAVAEHPHDDLVALLLAIESAGPGESAGPAAAALLEREAALARRAARYSPREDFLAHGLWALALVALERTDAARETYERFWSAAGGAAKARADRTVAFLAMAFFEVAGRVEQRGRKGAEKARGEGVGALEETPKRVTRARAVKVEEREPAPLDTPKTRTVRRSPRNLKKEV